VFIGRVSSYNMNTIKGRIYLNDTFRPIPFTLSDSAKDKHSIRAIVRSLTANALNPKDPAGEIQIRARSYTSRTGRLKWLLIGMIDHDYIPKIITGQTEQ
jgi:hypothetical protein